MGVESWELNNSVVILGYLDMTEIKSIPALVNCLVAVMNHALSCR